MSLNSPQLTRIGITSLETGKQAQLAISKNLTAILEQLPTVGALFPKISKTTDDARSAEFYWRCKQLGLEGVSLHSYAMLGRNAPKLAVKMPVNHGSARWSFQSAIIPTEPIGGLNSISAAQSRVPSHPRLHHYFLLPQKIRDIRAIRGSLLSPVGMKAPSLAPRIPLKSLKTHVLAHRHILDQSRQPACLR